MIRFSEKQQFILLQLHQGWEKLGKKGFDPFLDRVMSHPKHTLFSAIGLETINNEMIESLSFLNQQLDSSSKKLRIIHASSSLKKQIQAHPRGAAFQYSETILKAIEDFGATQNTLSGRQFIKAFINATTRTFYVQARTHCDRGEIIVKNTQNDKLLGDISGVVRVLGKQLSYGVMISFPKQTFLGLMKRMLGEDHSEINQDIQDGAAELMNIIFGQAKLMLNLRGAGLSPQLPIIAFSKEFQGLKLNLNKPDLTPLAAGKTIVIPFSSDIGDFFVEVWLPHGTADLFFPTAKS